MKAAELYDTDFAAWALRNAELLRSGRVAEADLENIAEEIEDLGKSKRNALESRFTRLIEHLLKCRYQPERRGTSWERSIVVQRVGIRRLLKQNPSLQSALPEVIGESYFDAVRIAAAAIKRPQSEFPRESPFTFDQLLDDEFLP